MGLCSDGVPLLNLATGRLHFSHHSRTIRQGLYQALSGCRYSHVHLELSGYSLLSTAAGSAWYTQDVARRLFRSDSVIEMGTVETDVLTLIHLTTGWRSHAHVWEHVWWWYGWGRRPVDCVWLTSRALTLLGFPTDADKVDEIHAKFTEAARPRDHLGTSGVA